MENLTEEQNKRLFRLLGKFHLDQDNEACAKLAKLFSGSRTTHTSELNIKECDALIKHLEFHLAAYEEKMRRLRWRLWFAFSESKYDAFYGDVGKDGKRMPHYSNIDRHCEVHWGVKISNMSEAELSKYIAIVKKWR